MKAFIIEKGTEVIAINYKKDASSSMDKKVMKDNIMYFIEDIKIDPVGMIGSHKGDLSTIDGQFARGGFYGFKLPVNKSGYETVLVHMSDVTVA